MHMLVISFLLSTSLLIYCSFYPIVYLMLAAMSQMNLSASTYRRVRGCPSLVQNRRSNAHPPETQASSPSLLLFRVRPNNKTVGFQPNCDRCSENQSDDVCVDQHSGTSRYYKSKPATEEQSANFHHKQANGLIQCLFFASFLF